MGTLNKREQAQRAFLVWLRNRHPRIFASVNKDAESAQMGGLFDSIGNAFSKIDFEKVSDGITKAGTAFIAVKGQRDLLKINLQRAKAGEPPLDYDSTGMQPTIRTKVGVDSSILLAGGAALVAFFLLRKR